LYLECRLNRAALLDLPDDYEERAVYVVAGELQVGRRALGEGQMGVVQPGRPLRLRANADSHCMVLGGAPLGQRHIWWNFVASSPERIERARADWQAGRFAGVPGDAEFIPLPGN
jgi:redox-sensitive bicupin YhaK (pirin superfamily)